MRDEKPSELDSSPSTGTAVTHLECSRTGERLEAGRVHNLSSAGWPLLVRYDLAALRKRWDGTRSPMHRARCGDSAVAACPLDQNIVSLHEGFTPLHRPQRLGE